MNKKKFEKVIAVVKKLEKNGYFSTKNKIKAAIKALFIRFRENPFDILFWPFYFLHLFLILIRSKFGFYPYHSSINKPFASINNLQSFLIYNKFTKKAIYEFDKTRFLIRIDTAIKALNEEERDFINNFLDYLIGKEKTAAIELFNLIKDIIIIDQYHAKEFIKNGYCVLDCGANIGIFSLYAAYLNENGKIYAIEPVKETLDIMQRLFDFFEVKNVKIIRKAVGDEKKRAFINIYPHKISALSGSTAATLLDVNYGKKEEIEVDTIDNIVREEKIKRIDFIKMDIEGYERYALKGAVETIKKHKPIIVVSAYHLADDKKVLPEIVKSAYANYEVKLVKEGDEDFIFVPKRTS
jgi:FkbM family methyltransferase